MRSLIIAATLLASAVAPPVLAAAPAAASAAPAADKRLALARRYFGAIHFDAMMKQMTERMYPPLMDSMLKQNPNLTEAQRKAIVEAATESGQAYTAHLGEKSIAIIADVFSEEELSALVAFYESPVAQTMLAKTPELTSRMTGVALEEMPSLQADLRKRLCAKLDCSKVKLPAGSPS